MFRNALCFSDLDCGYGYICEVIDSYNHMSECLHHSSAYYAGQVADSAGQLRNTERGHFELGYWCLKHTDCESKHCAQVGPRMYDKECQNEDYVDFQKPERKKRSHHRRDPEPEQEQTVESKESK